jgi:hypothetical protein
MLHTASSVSAFIPPYSFLFVCLEKKAIVLWNSGFQQVGRDTLFGRENLSLAQQNLCYCNEMIKFGVTKLYIILICGSPTEMS